MKETTASQLSALSAHFTPILNLEYGNDAYVALDLSVNNEALKEIDTTSDLEIQAFINSIYKRTQKAVAYGGYLEKRDIYKRSSYFNEPNPLLERNIHLGIDIWAKAGTQVIAPLAGKVHSVKNNINFGDYGPTIILKHTANNLTFYTLYGHLSVASIMNKTIGHNFEKGAVLGALGDPSINGNYAPHVHFQIILNLEDYVGDYPGVTNANQLDFYKENCPDPNLILKLY